MEVQIYLTSLQMRQINSGIIGATSKDKGGNTYQDDNKLYLGYSLPGNKIFPMGRDEL